MPPSFFRGATSSSLLAPENFFITLGCRSHAKTRLLVSLRILVESLLARCTSVTKGRTMMSARARCATDCHQYLRTLCRWGRSHIAEGQCTQDVLISVVIIIKLTLPSIDWKSSELWKSSVIFETFPEKSVLWFLGRGRSDHFCLLFILNDPLCRSLEA